MGLLLAVDTSQSQGQMVLFDSETVMLDFHWEKAKSHSEMVTEALLEVIQQTGVKLRQIEKLACVVGPGSFTGIRVGVNFAKSLAYSINCPMFSLNSLDLLALNALDSKQPILTALDAQKNSLFVSTYSPSLKPLLQNQVVPISRFEELVSGALTVCGSGLWQYKDFLPPKSLSNLSLDRSRDKIDLKLLSKAPSMLKPEQELPWQQVQPLYIKASAPEEKLNPTSM